MACIILKSVHQGRQFLACHSIQYILSIWHILYKGCMSTCYSVGVGAGGSECRNQSNLAQNKLAVNDNDNNEELCVPKVFTNTKRTQIYTAGHQKPNYTTKYLEINITEQSEEWNRNGKISNVEKHTKIYEQKTHTKRKLDKIGLHDLWVIHTTVSDRKQQLISKTTNILPHCGYRWQKE